MTAIFFVFIFWNSSFASNLSKNEIEALNFLEQNREVVFNKLLPDLVADMQLKKERTEEYKQIIQQYFFEIERDLEKELKIHPALLKKPRLINEWLHSYRRGIENLSLALQENSNMSGDQCLVFAIIFNIKYGNKKTFEFISEVNDLVEKKKISLGTSGDFSMYLLNVINCSYKGLVQEINRHGLSEFQEGESNKAVKIEDQNTKPYTLSPLEIDPSTESEQVVVYNKDENFDLEAQIYEEEKAPEINDEKIPPWAKVTAAGTVMSLIGYGSYELIQALK